MAFEPLAPPTLPAGIRKPTAEEIAEVMVMAVEQPRMNAEITGLTWPPGSHCACKRNHKDGKPCGHIWKTRAAGKPAACPKCKQARWDSEPKQRNRKKK